MKTEISKDYWRNKAKELAEENEQLRILLKDLYVNDELRKLAERYGVENE